MNRPAYYEPHPLPPGRKQELIAQGFRIIDAKFKPPGYLNPGEDEEPKVEKEKALTVDELRAALTALQIEFPEGAKKGELKALYEQATEQK